MLKVSINTPEIEKRLIIFYPNDKIIVFFLNTTLTKTKS